MLKLNNYYFKTNRNFKFLTVRFSCFFSILFTLLFSMNGLSSGGQESLKIIDDSVNLFFPQSLSAIQYSQTQFSIFWWNFLVIDPEKEGHRNEVKALRVCKELDKYRVQELSFALCGNNEIENFSPLLEEWAQDIVYRTEFPKDIRAQEFWLRRSRATLNQIAMISDAKMIHLFRRDPFATWEDLIERQNSLLPQTWSKLNGFLVDEKTQRIIIPIQFKVAPKLSNTENFFKEFDKDPFVHVIGSHRSAYLNEQTVHRDLNQVSWVGIVGFLVLIGILFVKKRKTAILLFLPMAISMLIAALMTYLKWGSIHGLTLAFGSAISGLALDYGLHGAFNSESKQTWISNAIGLFTTLAGLGTLLFCGIPLIQQMMFFSIVGIICGFILSYWMCVRFPQWFNLAPIDFKLGHWGWFSKLIVFVFILGWLGASKIDLNFDLRRFNYQPQDEKILSEWFYKGESSSSPYLFVHSIDDLHSVAPEYDWAVKNNENYQGVFNFYPSIEIQNKNFRSWQERACPFFSQQWNENEKSFYEETLNNLCSLDQNVKEKTGVNKVKNKIINSNKNEKKDKIEIEDDFDKNNLISTNNTNRSLNGSKRLYAAGYFGDGKTVSILRIKDPVKEAQFRIQNPEAHSIVESLLTFESILKSDLFWMIPLALFSSLLILGLYYKKIKNVFSSILPFLSGTGCFFIASLIMNDPIDLISILGLLMVFGFSIDYGVFATDLYEKNFDILEKVGIVELEKGVFSTLTLAALTNLVGFFPLIFAQHTVLHQLGMALFWGTVGTFLGALWGVPFIHKTQGLKNGL